MAGTSSKNVLDEILDPLLRCLTSEVAGRVVSTGLSAESQARINRLAAMAEAGTLTAAEQAEYEEFVEALDLVGIVKAKLRSNFQISPDRRS